MGGSSESGCQSSGGASIDFAPTAWGGGQIVIGGDITGGAYKSTCK